MTLQTTGPALKDQNCIICIGTGDNAPKILSKLRRLKVVSDLRSCFFTSPKEALKEIQAKQLVPLLVFYDNDIVPQSNGWNNVCGSIKKAVNGSNTLHWIPVGTNTNTSTTLPATCHIDDDGFFNLITTLVDFYKGRQPAS